MSIHPYVLGSTVEGYAFRQTVIVGISIIFTTVNLHRSHLSIPSTRSSSIIPSIFPILGRRRSLWLFSSTPFLTALSLHQSLLQLVVTLFLLRDHLIVFLGHLDKQHFGLLLFPYGQLGLFSGLFKLLKQLEFVLLDLIVDRVNDLYSLREGLMVDQWSLMMVQGRSNMILYEEVWRIVDIWYVVKSGCAEALSQSIGHSIEWGIGLRREGGGSYSLCHIQFYIFLI